MTLQTPILGVSVALVRDKRVLLVRRARSPYSGLYSFPGGRVQFGETLERAALRELEEETGYQAAKPRFMDYLDMISSHHFVICVFAASWTGGVERLNDEVDDAVWVDPLQPLSLECTPHLEAFLTRTLHSVG